MNIYIKKKSAILAMIAMVMLFSLNTYAVDGKAVYNKACKLCHEKGVAGAPKYGDKNAWTERIANGVEALENNAIKGYKGKKGVMPPKGGFGSLKDDEVKAAVAFMLQSIK